MSVRLISQKGQTANLNIGHPAVNFKWIVKWALIVLHTGTTTGNRAAQIQIVRANVFAYAMLAYTGTQSGTSTTYYASGDVMSQQDFVSSSSIFYQFPEIYAIDVLQLSTFLQSGDTVDYYILVEEAAT